MKKDFNEKRVLESTSLLTILEELDSIKSHFQNEITMYQPIKISKALQIFFKENSLFVFTLFPDEHTLFGVENRYSKEYFLFLK